MTIVRGLTMTLAFALELAMLGAFFVWGVSVAPAGPLQFVAGFGAPALAILVWGLFLAPRSERRAAYPWRVLTEALVLGLAALALLAAGRAEYGVGIALVSLARFGLGAVTGLDRTP